MPELERLRAGRAPAILAFERAHRAYFAASVSDHGNEFFERFTDRLGAVRAAQEADVSTERSAEMDELDMRS
ncbi:hypothetical protein [Streptomyces sp. NBC_01334]|uniref:hypothetical protein n=1 Tax=Streptomyces sp. NBC_01334 TaxID=2903827 RepID=UPI003FA37E1E